MVHDNHTTNGGFGGLAGSIEAYALDLFCTTYGLDVAGAVREALRMRDDLELVDLLSDLIADDDDLLNAPFPVALRAVEEALPALLDYAEAWDRRVAQARRNGRQAA